MRRQNMKRLGEMTPAEQAAATTVEYLAQIQKDARDGISELDTIDYRGLEQRIKDATALLHQIEMAAGYLQFRMAKEA